MKKNIITKGIASALVALTMGSCASDYLDLEPITSIDDSTVTATVDGAQYGMYGVCRLMWWAYGAWGVGQRFVQGESAINTIYGDVLCTDAFYWVWGPYDSSFFTGGWTRIQNYWPSGIAWRYYYNIVASSNKILDDIDSAEGDPAKRDMVKAQLLTMRAHAYTKLVQLYAPRWENSNNGQAYCLVLRLHDGVEAMPLVTMNEVMTQIYADLDQAIALYQSCGLKRTRGWEPNIDIARGIYARAAMTRHDWAKAQEMAHNARAGYNMMTAAEYKAGFAEANQEWMWYNAPEQEGIYYWSWAAMYGCNGAYTSFWGMAAGAINYELYKEMHDGDIRKDLYFTPDKINYNSPIYRGLSKASWWNGQIVNPVNMDLNNLNAKMKTAVKNYGNYMIPDGDVAKWGQPYTKSEEEGASEDPFVIPFGAQYKFWGIGDYSITSYPFMRAAEMALYEAEAAYRLGYEDVARQCLEEVNSNRFSNGYTCTLSGDDLWKEIMLTSRVEFWGEGHCWYNFKRWNIDAVRNVWEEGNVDSNNIPLKYKAEIPANSSRGWSYIVPEIESRYNNKIDMSLVAE